MFIAIYFKLNYPGNIINMTFIYLYRLNSSNVTKNFKCYSSRMNEMIMNVSCYACKSNYFSIIGFGQVIIHLLGKEMQLNIIRGIFK